MNRPALPAFAGFGIEIEYMIVARSTLDVRPLAAEFLQGLAGRETASFERAGLGWSNELVAHVIELKNAQPAPSLESLAVPFQEEVDAANDALAPLHACLMPGGMHPWMSPATETHLWTLDNAKLYGLYDRIFDCRRHGWSNLQAMHINLPFSGDDQFARLHAAIRCVLPLIPALAASSPYVEGRAANELDHRLAVYKTNSKRCPALTGDVVPERADTRSEYERDVLAPMFRQIAPFDPEGLLRHDWLNSHGAIARFERSAIEIRLADTQECVQADLAVANAIVAVVRALYEERWASFAAQREVATPLLARVLDECIRDADMTTIAERSFLGLFDSRSSGCTAGELWTHLLQHAGDTSTASTWLPSVRHILQEGTLARRIVDATGGAAGRDALRPVYAALCDCLAHGNQLTV